MTVLLYLDQENLFTTKAKILSSCYDKRGSYITLNKTLFYPQGGGQPADQGQIVFADKKYQVYDVRIFEGEVRHYVNELPKKEFCGLPVSIFVDSKRRSTNTRYHTAGHLIAAVTSKYEPSLRAVKGHQFPGEAYVEFSGKETLKKDLLTTLQTHIADVISQNSPVKTGELSDEEQKKILYNLPYEIAQNKKIRFCTIAGYPPTPCGGTHVQELASIETLKIKKIKIKQEKIKISYEIK
jgi:alanyl-tRNA synthetase